MPNQMDDATIIRALRACSDYADCYSCPICQAGNCYEVRGAAADRLEALGRENEELRKRAEAAKACIPHECPTCIHNSQRSEELCPHCVGDENNWHRDKDNWEWCGTTAKENPARPKTICELCARYDCPDDCDDAKGAWAFSRIDCFKPRETEPPAQGAPFDEARGGGEG